MAAEIARRVAQRLEVLAAEYPADVAGLRQRLAEGAGEELLGLSRLPGVIADREPPRLHLGVAGFDYRNGRLILAGGDPALAEPRYLECDPAILDDDDLCAARRVVPETLPGYFLG